MKDLGWFSPVLNVAISQIPYIPMLGFLEIYYSFSDICTSSSLSFESEFNLVFLIAPISCLTFYSLCLAFIWSSYTFLFRSFIRYTCFHSWTWTFWSFDARVELVLRSISYLPPTNSQLNINRYSIQVAKAIEVYHDENYKSRRWFFPSHNFTVSVVWSPYLAKSDIFEDINGVSTSENELHLDKLDNIWTNQYKSFDYMIFSGGKWFTKSSIYLENNNILGCHHCTPKRNLTELGFNFAYRKVLKNVFDYIIKSNTKATIFYRTSTPDHFENGEWFSGGTCQRKEPAKRGEFRLNELVKILREVELDEYEKASVKASEKGVNLRLFDVNPLSLLRPDGHPGPYRFFQPFAKDKNATVIRDCLHWCLPGPIDSWNDLLMEMLVNGWEKMEWIRITYLQKTDIWISWSQIFMELHGPTLLGSLLIEMKANWHAKVD